jgi:predicted class III extradiol MEMO1 family dioxygenase
MLLADHHPDCYPSKEGAALDFFRHALGLGEKIPLPPAPTGVLSGIIVPHIDFRVSLPAYAAAFRPLLEAPLAETYVILGVGHRSRLEWNLDRRDYVTPLGRAVCATDLVDRLAGDSAPVRMFEPAAHAGEHSIEFALLWLQALHRLHASGSSAPVRFVPVLCGGLHTYVEGLREWDDLAGFHRLSSALGSILRENAGTGRLRVIVSIDGCHLGPRFQHPFRVTPELLQATAGWEQLLWSCAAKGDARAFLDWMSEEGNDRYFDGVGALALLLAAGEGKFRLQRTYYEQWFTERDASAVTFSSGRVLS